jgi:hypothetical protein
MQLNARNLPMFVVTRAVSRRAWPGVLSFVRTSGSGCSMPIFVSSAA